MTARSFMGRANQSGFCILVAVLLVTAACTTDGPRPMVNTPHQTKCQSGTSTTTHVSSPEILPTGNPTQLCWNTMGVSGITSWQFVLKTYLNQPINGCSTGWVDTSETMLRQPCNIPPTTGTNYHKGTLQYYTTSGGPYDEDDHPHKYKKPQ